MEFKINDVFYHTTSGSLSKVIYQVNYHFIESASGTGADSGSIYYASQQHSTSPLDPVSSASFVAYDDVTEANVKTWCMNQYITQSSLPGAPTASLWGTHTSSIKSNLDQQVNEQITPSWGKGTPWS